MKKKKKMPIRDEDRLEFLGKKYNLPSFNTDEVNIGDFTDYNIRNFEDDLENLPKYLSIFGILQAKALKKMKKAETIYRVWVATESKSIRNNWDKKGEKYTESKVTNELHSNIKFKIKKYSIHRAEEEYEIIKAIYWSIQKKGEVLLEVSRQRSSLSKLDNLRTEKNN